MGFCFFYFLAHITCLIFSLSISMWSLTITQSFFVSHSIILCLFWNFVKCFAGELWLFVLNIPLSIYKSILMIIQRHDHNFSGMQLANTVILVWKVSIEMLAQSHRQKWLRLNANRKINPKNLSIEFRTKQIHCWSREASDVALHVRSHSHRSMTRLLNLKLIVLQHFDCGYNFHKLNEKLSEMWRK